MIGRIIRSVFWVSMGVWMASLLVAAGCVYYREQKIQEEHLQTQLSLLIPGIQEGGLSYLEGLSLPQHRLVWIRKDGQILWDSWDGVDAPSEAGGWYPLVQPTRSTQTVRLSDGSILQLTGTQNLALGWVVTLLQPMIWLGIVILLAVLWLSRSLAQWILRPLNGLDFEHPMDHHVDVDEELSPLLRRMDAQHQQIRIQMESLQQSQEEFQQITEYLQEGLVLLDLHGKILSMNPAARTLFGVEDSCIAQDFLTVERGSQMRRAMAQAMEQGQSQIRQKHHGREYQFDLSRICSQDQVHGLVILAFDVTEQVDRERNRREFTANVSHELKTPLQSIIGSAELIENGIVREEDLPRFIGHIRQEASRLVTLIEDIIHLSQLDEGVEMPVEELSLLHISKEVRDSLADAAQRRGIHLEVLGGEGRMLGVYRLLYEVIYNLCDNSIRYNRPGGWIRMEVADGEDGVDWVIQDSGIGIAPEDQGKVFERFYRVDKSHARESGGTGLGLSIVKHAVQYHQGLLHMTSVLGEGTTLSLHFPRDVEPRS